MHQDVYLHSLTALEEAAGRLADDESIGLLGAFGVTSEGGFVGRVRDRIFLVGAPAREPTTVDSVDELLFMVPRRLLEREPLTEDPELAWHAYAVEYGLRVRAQGRRVCAVDIPVTHNSLTVNLDRLELAYAAVAAKHPAGMPVFTPQGKVPRGRKRTGGLSAHRWRYRWLLESIRAQRGRRAMGAAPWVLADVRLDIDDVLARMPADAPLLVLNVDAHGDFIDERPGPLALTRAGRPILFTSATRGEVLRRSRRRATGLSSLRTSAWMTSEPWLARLRPAARSWAFGRRSAIGRCSGLRGRRCRRPGGSAGRRRSACPRHERLDSRLRAPQEAGRHPRRRR